jgi:hypothetical protein
MTSPSLPVVSGESSPSERLRLAVAAYLARYRGLSREHTLSDLRVFLGWCAERDLDPLEARRAHLELVRALVPGGTPLRALDGVTSHLGGVRVLPHLIDGVLEHSPAEWLRRPTVPPESPPWD